MQDTLAKAPSRRARIVLYLVGVAAMAVPWGYLLFVRPRLRARSRVSAMAHETGLGV